MLSEEERKIIEIVKMIVEFDKKSYKDNKNIRKTA